MFWRLRETKNPPLKCPKPPTYPPRENPRPGATQRSDVGGPFRLPKPPAPAGYEWK